MSLRRPMRVLAPLALIAFVFFQWGRAASVLDAPQVVALSATSVTVSWRTDVPTGTRVAYGLAAAHLDQSAEGGLTDAHSVRLNGLQTGAKYFFSVGTARKQLATGHFIMSSSPAAVTAPPSSSRTSSAAVPGRVSTPAAAAPPARTTWGNPGSLQDHYDRHGADFAAKSPEDYAAQAWRFRQRARTGGLLVKVDEDGVQRVFDPSTGAFAAYNRDGTTKTFFKPGSRDYFSRQPGQSVKTATP